MNDGLYYALANFSFFLYLLEDLVLIMLPVLIVRRWLIDK